MKTLLIIYILLHFLSSCATGLKEIDKPVCVAIDISRGYCTTIISGKGFYVNDHDLLDNKTWFEMTPEMILVPVGTWAALKKYLIFNCKKSKACNANIDSWSRSIETLETHIEPRLSSPLFPDESESIQYK